MRESDPVIAELSRVGIKGITGQGEFLRGYCPFHTGSSGRTFSFNRTTGRWSCFSTRCQHHKGGDLVYLLYLSGLDREHARARASTLDLKPSTNPHSPTIVNQNTLDSSGKLQPGHLSAWRVNWQLVDYLYKCQNRDEPPACDKNSIEWEFYKSLRFLMERGLKPEPLMRLDVGIDPQVNLLTFPLRDTSGGLLGVARRMPQPGKPYVIGGNVYAPGSGKGRFFKVNRGECLWGWHEQSESIQAGAPIVVVEGYADVLHLMGIGVTAVAKLSSKLTQSQIKVLQSVDNEIVLWPDRDTAGLHGVVEDITRLISKANVRAILPEYPDPAETPHVHIQAALSSPLDSCEYLNGVTSLVVSY